MKLNYTSIASAPFCDYLNVTMALTSYEPLLASLAYLIDCSGLTSYDGVTYSAEGNSGTLVIKRHSRFLMLSASGGILQHFRNLALYDEYISILSEYPSKITRLDATADYYVSDVPEVIKSVKRAGMASKIALSRKAISKEHVKVLLGLNAEGIETGTVYLGDRSTHSVFAKVYDKGHERLSKGFSPIGSVVRVELSLKNDTGVSLRDAHSPESVFFHYASPCLVVAPPHFAGWQPNITGYAPDKPQIELFTAAGKIQNIFSFSAEVGRAMKLAVLHYPGEALEVLVAQFRTSFFKRYPDQSPFSVKSMPLST